MLVGIPLDIYFFIGFKCGRERPFAAVAFATSSRIQTNRNELKDEHIYIEREEEEGHFLRLRYREAKEEGERNGGNRVKSFLLIYRAVAFPGCCSYDDTKICRHTTKGREGAKIERIRFAFWLLCPRRRGVGRESETVGREIRV